MVVRKAVEAHERGLLTTVVRAFFMTVLVFLGSLVLSIVVEWIGMTWFWNDQGVAHSRWMLEREASFIAQDFRRGFLNLNPVQFAAKCADVFHYLVFEVTRLVDVIHYVQQPVHPSDTWFGGVHASTHAMYLGIAHYVEAAINMVQVFALRLAVLVLSLPFFILFSLIASADGWVERDLRRLGLGDESGFTYHPLMKAVKPTFIGAWLVYLSLPTSVHPNLVIVPFATLVALLVGMTVSKFKKYW